MINYRINRIEHDYLISTDAPCTFYEAMLDLTTPEMKQVLTTFSIYEDEIISGFNIFFKNNKNIPINKLLYGTISKKFTSLNPRLNFTQLYFLSIVISHMCGVVYINYLQWVSQIKPHAAAKDELLYGVGKRRQLR